MIRKWLSAIRKLSDLKEDREATKQEIDNEEEELKSAREAESRPSEATLLSRLHWWTVEYGLIGTINNPKIYGAGLLSSVGESQNCLKSNVKKIPLTIDCINYSYDITEQQPQLFVAQDFSDHVKLLELLKSKEPTNLPNFFIGPRSGTISPWASKTSEIIANVGIKGVKRIENYVGYYVKNKSISFKKIL